MATMFPEGENTLTRAQTEVLLALSLGVLMDDPDATLLDLQRLLTDETYRARIMKRCSV